MEHSNATAVIAPKGGRIVAVSYRDKEVMREGVVIEQRPTMVLIVEPGKENVTLTLKDEDHEMCFRSSRAVTLPATKEGGKPVVIDYTDIGIRAGDIVLTIMGGSGGFYVFALSRRLERLGAGGVYQIGSTLFKRLCDEHKLDRSKVKDIDDEGKRTEVTFDHLALPKLFELASDKFHRVTARERDLIILTDVVRRRKEAMNDRMACAHRVLQRSKKMVYCTEEDAYPEGGVKVAIELSVSNDAILRNCLKEEHQIDAELKKLLHGLPVWKVFEPIEGVGELTAGPLIVAIGDIHRFPGSSQLKAFLGMHTLKQDGSKFVKGEKPEFGNSKFARRRQGQLSNWNQEGRQALYQIAEQFTKWRQNSPWGQVAQEVEKRFLAKHPCPQVWVKDAKLDSLTFGQVIRMADINGGKRVQGGWELTYEVDGKQVVEVVKGVTKFNPAHINRMVAWRTMTKFVEWLFKAWKATEAGQPLPALPYGIGAPAEPDAGVQQAA
jgi:hypothetical protein